MFLFFSATDARYDVCLRVCRVICAKVVGTTSSNILRVYNIDDGSLIRHRASLWVMSRRQDEPQPSLDLEDCGEPLQPSISSHDWLSLSSANSIPAESESGLSGKLERCRLTSATRFNCRSWDGSMCTAQAEFVEILVYESQHIIRSSSSVMRVVKNSNVDFHYVCSLRT